MKYYLEFEKVDGTVTWWKRKNGERIEYVDPRKADGVAEHFFSNLGDMGQYVRFSVVRTDGETYSDWEC